MSEEAVHWSVMEFDAAVRLAIAALIGLGAGLEREWSGHTRGPAARFAGLRTFLLLGTTGGTAGVLLSVGAAVAGAALIAGGMALAAIAYLVTARRPEAEVDGTTEAAAVAVVALGTLAGMGWVTLAAAAGSLMVLALREKSRLHWLVGRVSERELRAAMQFAVLALVVLPLLPVGPIGGVLRIQPRMIWAIVLVFSAINFGGYLARRAVGAGAGAALTGLLGGLISSTAMTLALARRSRRELPLGASLAHGVIGACTVLMPRIVVISAALHPAVAMRLAAYVALPTLIGLAMVWRSWRNDRSAGTAAGGEEPAMHESPLRLVAAIQMALAFQVAMTVLDLVYGAWGDAGLYSTAALLGLTDMDALTVSMSRLDGGLTAQIAANAIVIGIIANTLLKAAIAAVLGAGRFRAVTLRGLALLGAATALSLALGWQ